jgi:DNA topoisomerase-2
LEDANDAGTKNSHLCTLILTEGDSAKSLAVAGLGVIGRDRYGVFPLRGKMLNVRECSHKQIIENAEINAMLRIVGLQYKMKYTSEEEMKTLRYGKIMIMTDQVNFIRFLFEIVTKNHKGNFGLKGVPFGKMRISEKIRFCNFF